MESTNEQQIVVGMTTERLAAAFGVKPNTPRVALTQQGHYCGIKPIKLPNRRLLWPVDAVKRALAGAAASSPTEENADLSGVAVAK